MLPNSSLVLGRSADDPAKCAQDPRLLPAEEIWGMGTKHGNDTSRRHTEIATYGDDLYVNDLDSRSGTQLRATRMTRSSADHTADHTMYAVSAARKRNLISPDGTKFADRTIVTRDTTLGGLQPEATVDIRSWVGGGEAYCG